MSDGLPQQDAQLLDGREEFHVHGHGVTQSLQLIDYWR